MLEDMFCIKLLFVFSPHVSKPGRNSLTDAPTGKRHSCVQMTERILMSTTGLSSRSVLAFSMLCTTSAPRSTPEDGVLVVEPGRGRGGDEELRAVRAGPRVGHRQRVRPVVPQRAVELVLELVAPDGRPAGAVAEGAPSAP